MKSYFARYQTLAYRLHFSCEK